MVRLPVIACRRYRSRPTSAVDRAEAEESDVIEGNDLATLERVADDDATLDVKAAADSELDRAALAALTSMATMEMSN